MPSTNSNRARRSSITRRQFVARSAMLLGGAIAIPLIGCTNTRPRRKEPTDIQVTEVSFTFEDFKYRAPVKFAGAIMDRATVITVECAVRTSNGKTAKGV